MTRDEAILLARRIAESESWAWRLPVSASPNRAFLLFGRLTWTVLSNSSSRGCNVLVVIDDRSGEVIRRAFLPR